MKKFRRLQAWSTALLFAATLYGCWRLNGFDIREIPLSYYGVSPITRWWWNGTLIGLGISLLHNVGDWLRHLRAPRWLYWPWALECGLLIGVGVFDMRRWHDLHHLLAWSYFLSLPLLTFLSTWILKHGIPPKRWALYLVISATEVILPLWLWSLFPGVGTAELAHSALVILWSLLILRER